MSSPFQREKRPRHISNSQRTEDDADNVQFVGTQQSQGIASSVGHAPISSDKFYGDGASPLVKQGHITDTEVTPCDRPAKRSVRIQGSLPEVGSAQKVSDSVVQDLDSEREAERSGPSSRQLRPRMPSEEECRIGFPIPRRKRIGNTQAFSSSSPADVNHSRSRSFVEVPVSTHGQIRETKPELKQGASQELNSIVSVKQTREKDEGRSMRPRRASADATRRTLDLETIRTLRKKTQAAQLKPEHRTEIHDLDSYVARVSVSPGHRYSEPPIEVPALPKVTSLENLQSGKSEIQTKVERSSDAVARNSDKIRVASDKSIHADLVRRGFLLPKFDEPPSRVLFSFPPGERRGKVQVTTDDLGRLHTGCYLNDSLVDFYVKWVDQVLAPSMNDTGSNFFFSSFFFGRLRCSSPIDYAGVRRWTNDADDLFKKRYVFVPVCDSNHWSLILVANLDRIGPFVEAANSQWVGNSTDRPSVLYLDSLSSARGTEFAKVMKAYLVEEWLFRKEQECDSGKQVTAARREDVKTVFGKVVRVVKPRVPIQNNEFDCGLYLLYNIVAFLRNDEGFRAKCFLSPTLFKGSDALQRAYGQGDIRVLRIEFQNVIRTLMTLGARRAVDEDDKRRENWNRELNELKSIFLEKERGRELENSAKKEGGQDQNTEVVAIKETPSQVSDTPNEDASSCLVVVSDDAAEIDSEAEYEEKIEDFGSVENMSPRAEDIERHHVSPPGESTNARIIDNQLELCAGYAPAGRRDVTNEETVHQNGGRVVQNGKPGGLGQEEFPIARGSADNNVTDKGNNMPPVVDEMLIEIPQSYSAEKQPSPPLNGGCNGTRDATTNVFEGRVIRKIDACHSSLPRRSYASAVVVGSSSAKPSSFRSNELSARAMPLAKRTRRMSYANVGVRKQRPGSTSGSEFERCSVVRKMEMDDGIIVDLDENVSMEGSPVVTPDSGDEGEHMLMTLDSGDVDLEADRAGPMDES
jgi:Ulp1 protease family, C-terminal catalytic domain